MDWLIILLFIGISLYDSVKKSNKAKQQHAERQKPGGQTIYKPDGGSMPTHKPVMPQQRTPQRKSGNLLESLTEFLESVDNMLDEEDHADKKVTAPSAGKPVMKQKQKQKQAVPQAAKKSPAELPKQTLMEQRPDREQREEHKKVAASVKPIAPTVKPLTANVKPLKNAFNNDEHCEHRIELNPNIQYSNQKQEVAAQRAAIVRTDPDSLIQGIVWSEILGKPKAYQRREHVLQRR